MRRLALLFALSAPLLPVSASAQTLAIDSALSVTRNGKSLDNGSFVYATVADCGGDSTDDVSEPSTFTFSVTTYQANVPVVEAWLGVNDEDCNNTMSRIRGTSGNTAPVCTYLGRVNSNSRSATFQLSARKLFKQAQGDVNVGNDVGRDDVDTPSECDKIAGSPIYTVWIIPLDAATTANTAAMPKVVASLSTLKARFTPYTTRPSAPEGVGTISGEDRLGLSYKMTTSSTGLTRYKGYYDYGTGGGAGCGSGVLEPLDGGARLPPVNQPNVRASGESKGSEVFLTDVSGIPLDQDVAGAVVQIDPAGNESRLSQVQCIEHINTDGYLDACNNDPACQGSLHSCSFNVGSKGGAFSALLFGLAVVGLLARRRRS